MECFIGCNETNACFVELPMVIGVTLLHSEDALSVEEN